MRGQVMSIIKKEAAEQRVALVHDWLTGMRGGEKVLEVLCRRFPEAPLWTLLHVPGRVSKIIEARNIYTSLLQRMPFAVERYRSYLPLFPLFAELHKAGHSNELVISTSHAVAKAMVNRSSCPRPFHICYIHTPMRYVWDMFDEYFGPDRAGTILSRFVFAPVARWLQFYDRRTSDRVDIFVANSNYVAERVRRIYGRDAVVIAPPVDTERFLSLTRDPQDWYLIVSAMVPYKRVDHAIRAAAALKFHLKLVGTGPELGALRQLALTLGASVDFIGFITDGELGEYYRKARALLFPGIEDFGIVPVEAISSGCPVIALGVGGIVDSMTEETAVLYDHPTPQALQQAILTFEERPGKFREKALRARAELFSEKVFLFKFEAIVTSALQKHSHLINYENPGAGESAPVWNFRSTSQSE
jgi:glycosyltransferase involved in cell wall biosynthesis